MGSSWEVEARASTMRMCLEAAEEAGVAGQRWGGAGGAVGGRKFSLMRFERDYTKNTMHSDVCLFLTVDFEHLGGVLFILSPYHADEALMLLLAHLEKWVRINSLHIKLLEGGRLNLRW